MESYCAPKIDAPKPPILQFTIKPDKSYLAVPDLGKKEERGSYRIFMPNI